jgi:hypothetical protein
MAGRGQKREKREGMPEEGGKMRRNRCQYREEGRKSGDIRKLRLYIYVV